MNEESIFIESLQKDTPADQSAFLEQACAGNEALRHGVDMLLKAHAKAGQFLKKPPAEIGLTRDQAISESPGTMIGPYKLLQQIGEGGMGTVYMAEQIEPVKRKVALKVIKPGMDSRQVIARFEAERQALAMMDHVNIARVFDGGTTEAGRPYFVMELVHGVPITKYCDDNHLTPRQRLELFVPVCQAIQHAHQKGIIHRDIKPSNVMVTLYDGKPVPKVIDFGVAKATEQKLTERTLFTQYGTMVGTLEYMSPEQAEMSALGVDTRSDIYSLGVLLYELLTGSTPLTHKRMKEAAYAEILRMIKEEEPPKPSTRLSDSGEALASISAMRKTEPAKLTKLVKGELDWIVMKTLEKDRNRRYETAKDFAADVQRYLGDEAVQACPPSVGYRFRKFARRNKRALAMVAVVAVAVLIAATTLGWSVRDREAREQEIALETARKLALTEQGIRQALDRGTTSLAELHVILKKPGGVQQLLNQLARWELLSKTAQGELSQARQLAVRAEGSLDAESTQAMDKLEQQLTSDQADYDMALRLEKIRLDKATWVGGQFDDHKAADEYLSAFAGFAVLTDDPAGVAARLSSSPIKDQLVAALDDWAWVAFVFGKQNLVEQLLAIARQAAPDPAWGDRLRQPKVWRNQEALGKLVAEAPAAGLSPPLLFLVGSLLRNDKPLQESWLRQAQAEHPADFWLNFNLARTLQETSPVEAAGFWRVALAVRPGNIAVYTNLGVALHHQKKLPEAIAAFQKAIEIDPKHAFAYGGLGNALSHQKKLDEAVAAYRKAIEIDPKHASAYSNLGLALRDQKKLDEAITAFQKAIEIDPKHAFAYTNLGLALRDQKKLPEAIAAHHKAIEIDPKFARAYTHLGALLCDDLQEYDKAIASFHKAIEIDPKLAVAYYNLGNALSHQKKLDEAVAAFRKAIEIDPKHAAAYYNLGTDLYGQGKLDEAIVAYNKAIELDPKYAIAYGGLGIALSQQNKRDDAIAAFHKAIEIDPKNAVAYYSLGLALAGQKKLDEAITAYNKAIEIDPKFARAYTNLGNALRIQKKLPAAIAAYNRAIEIDPKLAAAYYNLGATLYGQGKLDEEIAAFRKAIKIDPKLAIAYTALGTALYGQGKLDEAVDAYRKVIELDPKDFGAYVGLGNILFEQKKWDEAVAAYRKAAELIPNNGWPHARIGDALRNKGDMDGAIAAYRKVVELNPKLTYAQVALGNALMTKGWNLANRAGQLALEASKEAVEFAPNSEMTWQYLGWIHYRTGNWKLSIEALEKSCKLQKGGTGDSGQWIVLALAHAKLAAQEGLSEKEREHHKAEARRQYEQADKKWVNVRVRPIYEVGQAIWDFRAEARELLGVKESKK